VLLCMVITLTKKAAADPKWETCTVEMAGCNDVTGEVEIKLKPDGKSKGKMFVAPAGEEDRMLAIALTAMASGSGMKVKAKIDYAAGWGSEIDAIRLVSGQ